MGLRDSRATVYKKYNTDVKLDNVEFKTKDGTVISEGTDNEDPLKVAKDLVEKAINDLPLDDVAQDDKQAVKDKLKAKVDSATNIDDFKKIIKEEVADLKAIANLASITIKDEAILTEYKEVKNDAVDQLKVASLELGDGVGLSQELLTLIKNDLKGQIGKETTVAGVTGFDVAKQAKETDVVTQVNEKVTAIDQLEVASLELPGSVTWDASFKTAVLDKAKEQLKEQIGEETTVDGLKNFDVADKAKKTEVVTQVNEKVEECNSSKNQQDCLNKLKEVTTLEELKEFEYREEEQEDETKQWEEGELKKAFDWYFNAYYHLQIFQKAKVFPEQACTNDQINELLELFDAKSGLSISEYSEMGQSLICKVGSYGGAEFASSCENVPNGEDDCNEWHGYLHYNKGVPTTHLPKAFETTAKEAYKHGSQALMSSDNIDATNFDEAKQQFCDIQEVKDMTEGTGGAKELFCDESKAFEFSVFSDLTSSE